MKTDQLHKIWPFLDMSHEQFRKVYQPGKQLLTNHLFYSKVGYILNNILKQREVDLA